jgi:uncharacterized protein (TIGR03435 family)
MRFPALLLFAASLTSFAQTAPPAQADSPYGKPLPWDTISIHETDPSHLNDGFGHDAPNGISEHALSLDFLISEAYTFSIFPAKDLIEGLPKWATEKHYDVEARVAPEDVAAYKKLTDLPIPEIVKAFQAHQYTGDMLMNQALLAERFKLKVHTEMREKSVLLLTVAKGGVKMKPAADPKHGTLNFSRGSMSGKGVPLSFIGSMFSMPAGAIVVDKTGDLAQYDFELKYAPMDTDPNAAGASNEADLFTAIQEQLGLKLSRGKTEVPVVVVDHIESPSDN